MSINGSSENVAAVLLVYPGCTCTFTSPAGVRTTAGRSNFDLVASSYYIAILREIVLIVRQYRNLIQHCITTIESQLNPWTRAGILQNYTIIVLSEHTHNLDYAAWHKYALHLTNWTEAKIDLCFKKEQHTLCLSTSEVNRAENGCKQQDEHVCSSTLLALVISSLDCELTGECSVSP